jgi:TetR/AcrR family transcriptional repressor of nem operon
MLSEVARADEPTRRALASVIDTRARELARRSPEEGPASARQRAFATLALCIGGLALARAMRGHPASDQVLRACRQWADPDRRSLPIRTHRSRRTPGR